MSAALHYDEFLESKRQLSGDFGFDPVWLPDFLYPFQSALVEWAVRKGRAAIFADCGLGKTPMQLVWAENVVRHTDSRVLVLTPLAVAGQTKREADRFSIASAVSRDGALTERIVITNYEQLAKFKPSDFVGVVCDESSILKNFSGVTRKAITEFARLLPYRLLCTATAAPNDYMELGTSSEALGYLERKHMLAQFFTHDGGETSKWRIKGHAREHLFWRWICTWARAMRKPSDMGFDDNGFILPKLTTRNHVVHARIRQDGCLFDLPSIGLNEQRQDNRRTLTDRCEMAAQLVNGTGHPAICWCHLNSEGDLLASLIPDAVQVSGSDLDEFKEQTFERFAAGDIRVIVTKPTIAGFGLNWQHCAHQTFFPSHSFEQWYQAVRRSWRFGQKFPVTIDVITTDGQIAVMDNMKHKIAAADRMFANLVSLMNDELEIDRITHETQQENIPAWL